MQIIYWMLTVKNPSYRDQNRNLPTSADPEPSLGISYNRVTATVIVNHLMINGYNEEVTCREVYESEYLRIPKILLLGDTGVGKSSLLSRFALDSFDESGIYNIGVDFRTRKLRLDGRDVKVNVWDTAGGERFHTIINCYIRGAYGVIVVYDVTNEASFNNLEGWLERINHVLGEDAVDKLLIGNKCDLTSQRVVDYATAKEFADKHRIPLVETSAKTSINVDQAFVQLIFSIMKRRGRQLLYKPSIKLTRSSPAQRIRDCC